MATIKTDYEYHEAANLFPLMQGERMSRSLPRSHRREMGSPNHEREANMIIDNDLTPALVADRWEAVSLCRAGRGGSPAGPSHESSLGEAA